MTNQPRYSVRNARAGSIRALESTGLMLASGSASQYAVLEPGPYSMICWWPDSAGKEHIMSGMSTKATVS